MEDVQQPRPNRSPHHYFLDCVGVVQLRGARTADAWVVAATERCLSYSGQRTRPTMVSPRLSASLLYPTMPFLCLRFIQTVAGHNAKKSVLSLSLARNGKEAKCRGALLFKLCHEAFHKFSMGLCIESSEGSAISILIYVSLLQRVASFAYVVYVCVYLSTRKLHIEVQLYASLTLASLPYSRDSLAIETIQEQLLGACLSFFNPSVPDQYPLFFSVIFQEGGHSIALDEDRSVCTGEPDGRGDGIWDGGLAVCTNGFKLSGLRV
ncbi:hypothetical protein RHSIM_RhsimUnG0193100 [Rhododendron simsii]|uniref:Uncharacterized protein n=1 Tax=Rhododendron simsii TaxID=118357 RepID=A0A834L283_RHOSS|nr:hypothetical protein RHSIM_RhsimUnG0193100 [Rhododendron simsii]